MKHEWAHIPAQSSKYVWYVDEFDEEEDDMKDAIIYLRVPLEDEATPKDLESVLELLAGKGFTTDAAKHLTEGKLIAAEAGISITSIFDAVSNAKLMPRTL